MSVRETALSSHLTISYSATPTASSASAAAPGTDAPAADSPLGFLAALVDQLLAGSALQPQATADTAAVAADTGLTTPVLFNPDDLTLAPETPPAVPPRGVALLAQLTSQLATLQQQLDAGETPDPKLLERIGTVADALAALIAPPTDTETADPVAALDPLKALASATQNSAPPPAEVPGEKKKAPTTPADQIAALLASLGVSLPTPRDNTAPAAPAPTSTVGEVASPAPALPALAELTDRLAALSGSVAATDPVLSKKLEALTIKLTAAEADPALLAQLTPPGESEDGTAIDRIVRALLDARTMPVAPEAPRLAAIAQLELPKAVVSDAVAAPLIEAEPAPLAAPTPKATLATTPVEAPRNDIRIEDDSTVAAIVADSSAAEAPDPAANTAAPPVAQNAPIAAPRAVPAAYQQAASPINMGQVAFEMVHQLHQGQSRFSFRIDPPELGRVDVRMHVDASGTVNARLTVERSETLDMFQRDQRALERALTQAGVDGGKANLEFSLKQNPFAGMSGGDQRPSQGQGDSFRFAATENDDAASLPAITLYRGTASAGGVNLFV